MKKAVLFTLLALAVASCDDLPQSPRKEAVNPRPVAVTTATKWNKNYQKPGPRPGDGSPQPLYISRSFDATVLAKEEHGFLVEGLSGRKYLLLPTKNLTEKPPTNLNLINYAQIKVKDKLIVYLSWKMPFVPVYFCEWVLLHGVKLKGGLDITPPGVRRDD